jgi:DNA invertase Pin-like site-specific DNA recombinase
VASQGWTLVSEHSDIASGKDDRRPGFQAALLKCRQLGAVLVAARLDRITRRAHTLSQLLEDGVSIRAADMPGADDLMMRIYAAMAQKERELISARTKAALAAAKARGTVLGGDRGYRPARRTGRGRGGRARRLEAERAAHRLALEVLAESKTAVRERAGREAVIRSAEPYVLFRPRSSCAPSRSVWRSVATSANQASQRARITSDGNKALPPGRKRRPTGGGCWQ